MADLHDDLLYFISLSWAVYKNICLAEPMVLKQSA